MIKIEESIGFESRFKGKKFNMASAEVKAENRRVLRAAGHI